MRVVFSMWLEASDQAPRRFAHIRRLVPRQGYSSGPNPDRPLRVDVHG
jgi:hypothetical protein